MTVSVGGRLVYRLCACKLLCSSLLREFFFISLGDRTERRAVQPRSSIAAAMFSVLAADTPSRRGRRRWPLLLLLLLLPLIRMLRWFFRRVR